NNISQKILHKKAHPEMSLSIKLHYFKTHTPDGRFPKRCTNNVRTTNINKKKAMFIDLYIM
ncbi:hypothetical protein, partial [Acinetobacter sp. Res13-Abat-PEC14-P4-01]|uniref:hypothetical protein n=1 Tax=Acinetobacter sp. Res13-Abat-PEC14-P4-01 TaxID=2777954 RepID=UPI001A90EEC2